jgi:hypothetical protein
MKKVPSSRSASKPQPQPTRHRFEHQVPTQIHDPEEDMMVLARWTHRAMKNKTRFWGTIIGVAVGLLALVLLRTLLATSTSGSEEVWTRLEAAKSAADRAKVADDFPGAPAAVWARLEAATEYYNQGFDSLPASRDVALPLLKKALENFDAVAHDAPKDSPQARAAALGKARTLEARNEIAKAIEQYQLVDQHWPGTPEAAQAKHLAAELKKPDAAAFYKEFYTYSPTKVTLPPMGTQSLDMPLIPAPGSGLPAGSLPGGLGSPVSLLPPPPPSPLTKKGSSTPKAVDTSKAAGTPAGTAPPSSILPESPFDSGKPVPKAEPATPSAPKASPAKPAEKPKS